MKATRSIRITSAALAGAALVTACGAEDPARMAASAPPVKVTLAVEDASLRKPGTACSGAGGYAYVRPGAAYEIRADGAVVARGVLGAGVAVRRGARAIEGAAVEPTTCAVTFAVALPDRDRYTLRLDRGAQLSFDRGRIRGGAVRLTAAEATTGAAVASPASPPAASVDGARGGRAALPGPLPAGARMAPVDEGAPAAPDFDLTLLDGTKVKGSRLWAQRPVVVVFTASWCARCAAGQAVLNDLAAKYRDLVAFVAIASQDTPADLERYLAAHDVPYAAGIDDGGAAWRSYAVAEPPTLAVIGKGGRLLHGWTVDVDGPTLDAALAPLAARG